MLFLFQSIFDVAGLVFSDTKKSRISDKEKASAHGGVEDEGVFEELLRTSGIVLKAGEGQNEIGMGLTPALCLYLKTCKDDWYKIKMHFTCRAKILEPACSKV